MRSKWRVTENLKILFFYTLDITMYLNWFDKLKCIKQSLYKVIEGNRNIWFGAIFPYMVIVWNGSISFSTLDVASCLCLHYQSVIKFNPNAIFFKSSFDLYMKNSPLLKFFWKSSALHCKLLVSNLSIHITVSHFCK